MKTHFTELTKAGLKIYRISDKKHVKTIPSIYKPIAEDFILKCDSKGIRLTDTERHILSTYDFEVGVFDYLEDLQNNEKYVFELVKNSKVISARKVQLRYSDRFELIFENGVKLKCNESLYLLCDNKSETINSNY